MNDDLPRLTDSSVGSPDLSIWVCVATYQRPLGLSALLDSLASQRGIPQGIDLRVAVVDNDPTAESPPAEAPAGLEVWFLSADRGITAARNVGVAFALDHGADFVAFIDDDEVASPGWLAEHLAGLRRSTASVSVGPVRPCFEGFPPRWVQALHERPETTDGAEVGRGLLVSELWLGLMARRGALAPVPATNNAVVVRDVFSSVGSFTSPHGLSGGSDRIFFELVARSGFEIAWTKHAEVIEYVPLHRQRLVYFIRRWFRLGNNSGLRARGLAAKFEKLITALLMIASGVVSIATGLLMCDGLKAIRGMLTGMRGAGIVAGVLGLSYRAYA